MAVTQLADVIEPSVFEPYLRLRTTELSALFEAGIAQTDPRVNALINGPGTLFNMPAWEDLASDEPNVSSDDPGSSATPKKITTTEDQAVKHMRNQTWSAADILVTIIGSDPMQEIADKVAGYWSRVLQKHLLIPSLQGVFADNVANDAGDMVYDIATDDAAAVTPAEKVSADAILQAMQTMGDASSMLASMAMHSVIATELKRQNLVDFIPNSRGEVTLARYLDKLVIVDDGMPAVAGANRITYSTYLFGPGALGFGEGDARVPVEVEREPLQGDGAGVEVLISRKVYGLHPRGVKFTESSVAGESPTAAELQAAANWDRVFDRKLIRLAELQTNG